MIIEISPRLFKCRKIIFAIDLSLVKGDEDETEMLDEEEEKRRDEMNKLRAEILPQTFLLLHSVLHNTGQHI